MHLNLALTTLRPYQHLAGIFTLGKAMSRSSPLCLDLAKQDVWDQNGHEFQAAQNCQRMNPMQAHGHILPPV